MEKQQDSMERAMKRLADQHREKCARIERDFLTNKQQLLRGNSHDSPGGSFGDLGRSNVYMYGETSI